MVEASGHRNRPDWACGNLWTSLIWYDYQRALPRHPDTVAGRVYHLNVHGIVVYQTRDERNWLDEIQYSSIAVFAVSADGADLREEIWAAAAAKVRAAPTPRMMGILALDLSKA